MDESHSLDYMWAIELPTPFPVGPVTVYLAAAPGEAVTLIDTGPYTAESRAALEAGLAARGHTVSSLERIVVTHAHADHFGLAAGLVADSGAEVLSHPWNAPALGDYTADRARRRAFYAGLMRQAGVPAPALAVIGRVTTGVDRFARPVTLTGTVDEGDLLRLAGRDWQVLHTPGHAAGLICLYEPQSRTLLASDHLLADISSNPVAEPPPPGQSRRLRSLALYRTSLQRVAALDVALALPGHGPVVRDVAGLVAERLAFHERRAARVLEALGHGDASTWDVATILFPDRSPLDMFLAVSEVVGHLELLEMEGRIEGRDVEGVTRWRVIEQI
jgi:glyoxylase-like metal-dependent hydrolase (beta-lactamase superfamily II)